MKKNVSQRAKAQAIGVRTIKIGADTAQSISKLTIVNSKKIVSNGGKKIGK